MTEEQLYDEAFATMDAEPLEYGEAQPEKPTSIRLSPATRRQIQWLSAQGHGNQSKVIALAVWQMYCLENAGHAPGKDESCTR